MLHVVTGDSEKKNIKELEKELIKIARYPEIHVYVSMGDNIAEEVETFVDKQKANLLVMCTHKLEFYEKLFGRSVTRQLAFHELVPLLTFNKTNEQFAIMQAWEFAFNFE